MTDRFYICWPVFDKVCLQGGCLYCQDEGEKAIHTREEILAQVPKVLVERMALELPLFTIEQAIMDLDCNTNRRVGRGQASNT